MYINFCDVVHTPMMCYATLRILSTAHHMSVHYVTEVNASELRIRMVPEASCIALLKC